MKLPWAEIVALSKSKASKEAKVSSQALNAELANGAEYTIPESSAPHAKWFADDPLAACGEIPGIDFIGVTTVNVARGSQKRAFVVSCSGSFLSEVVWKKRSTNSSYVAKSGAIVDFATFWGAVGKG